MDRSKEVVLELVAEDTSGRNAVFESIDACTGSLEEVSLAFFDISFVQKLELDPDRPLNLSVFHVNNGTLQAQGCNIRNINFDTIYGHQIWTPQTSRIIATSTNFYNINKRFSLAEPLHTGTTTSPMFGSCLNCSFYDCMFSNNRIEGDKITGGLFEILDHATFSNCSFLQNSGLAGYGCGLLFFSSNSTQRVSLQLLGSTFSHQIFLASYPPPEDPQSPLNLTLASIGCFLQSESINISVDRCIFTNNSAGAVGLFTVHAADRGHLMPPSPQVVDLRFSNVLFQDTHVVNFGTAAILRISLDLSSSRFGNLNHRLSFDNIRFYGSLAPQSGIIPVEGARYGDTILSSPTLIQVLDFAGTVRIINSSVEKPSKPSRQPAWYSRASNVPFRTTSLPKLYEITVSMFRTSKYYT